MKLETLLEKLDSYKAGSFVNLAWEREVSSAKAKKAGIKISKKSAGLIRTDVNYSALAAVQGIERGEKESWFEHYRKGLLQSKKDSSKKYLQAFPVPGKKISSVMVVDTGSEVYECDAEKLYADGLITKAALGSKTGTDTFIVSVENITSFGGNE